MAIVDIIRHIDTVKERAGRKFPGLSSDDMCYVVEYFQSDASPEVKLQAVPIEGTEWTQYINDNYIKNHRERRWRGKPSSLILIQSFKNPVLFHAYDALENIETYGRPFQRIEYLRSTALDPDGALLHSKPDVHDEVLRLFNVSRQKGNGWVCRLGNDGGGDEDLGAFEAVKIIYKSLLGVA